MSTLLFHWSPSSRRKGINRYGLVPGKRSIDDVWTAPYVAFADSPSLAWALSGGHPRGQGHGSWDLWTVWNNRFSEYEEFDGGTHTEVRVYERIYKRHLWFVGTRERGGKR